MLSGKVVLITGASSGIGYATALEFGNKGAILSLVGRNKVSLEKVAQECKFYHGLEPNIIVADVTEDAQLIMESTISAFDKLDILINCAGIIESGSIETTSLDQYDRLFNVNVKALYELTMLAVPWLIKTKGSIVNVSSVCGLRSFPGVLAYCMSKSAVDQFTKCIALELAPKQVRVNSVNPGVVVTNLHKRGGMTEEHYKQFLENCSKTHALGKPGLPEEVAQLIAFLASDAASFITGANVPIDGGRHAMCPR